MRIDFDYEENLKMVFNHYGLKEQLGQLSEECNELAIASHHYARGSKGMRNFALKDQLVGELADVINLVNQITGALRIAGDVNAVCKKKMERQVKRIAKEKAEAKKLVFEEPPHVSLQYHLLKDLPHGLLMAVDPYKDAVRKSETEAIIKASDKLKDAFTSLLNMYDFYPSNLVQGLRSALAEYEKIKEREGKLNG